MQENEGKLRNALMVLYDRLDPSRQGMGWPDPISFDGRSMEEQAADLLMVLEASQKQSYETEAIRILDDVESFYKGISDILDLPVFTFRGYKVSDGYGATVYYPMSVSREEAALEYCAVFREQAETDDPMDEVVKTWNTIPIYESDEVTHVTI